MALDFGTREIRARRIVGIRVTAKMSELGGMMGPLYGEVMGHIQRNGQEPAGMPLAVYYGMDGDEVDVECGIPVAPSMAGEGRIKAGELPAGTVATVTHTGPYEGLRETWAAMTEWMSSQGLVPAGAPWEVYVTDPGAEPDPSKWRTEIFFPVRRA